MAKLKLGPLVEDKPVKVTVELPESLHRDLVAFPMPIDDVFAAYRAILSSGVDPKNLVLAGDSDGGATVVTLMRKARDAGIALPAAGAAFSP